MLFKRYSAIVVKNPKDLLQGDQIEQFKFVEIMSIAIFLAFMLSRSFVEYSLVTVFECFRNNLLFIQCNVKR